MSRERPARRRDRTVALTRRGWAFLVFAFVAAIVAYGAGLRELLYIAGTLAILPLACLVVVWSGRPRLAVARTFSPHVLEAGSSATVAMTLRNLSGARSRGSRWADALPWAPGETAEAELPPLQPRGVRFAGRGNSATLRYELLPPRRGVFPIGPLHVEVGDAFGLARSSQSVGRPQPIVVTPEVVALADTGLTASAGDGESQLVQRRASGDEDDAMTREYRAGDAMRRVHWRASARHGDLMVRQEEQRSLPEARVIVDTLRTGYPDAGIDWSDGAAESASFEWVVRMLASVTVHLRRAGFIVTIDETGEAQLGSLGRRRQRTWGDEEFLVGLAAFALSSVPARRAAGDKRKGSGGTGPVIAIVGSPDAPTLDWLLQQRRPGDLAVAFMVRSVTSLDMIDRSFGVTSAGPNVGERLAAAGWLVVPVRSDDDHADAWEAVVIESGRSRAGA